MTLSMKVPTTGVPFLIDNLGKDCSLLQYLRELVQNSLDSFQRSGLTGEILIDVDSNIVEGTKKLRISDNAGGMDEKELISFINSLSVSGGTQSFAGNFGIGGKIAGITQNPEGMLYMSWKNGTGHMVQLWKDPTTGYGLKELDPDNPHSPWIVAIDDKYKPSIIDQHGTVVVLLGKSEVEDTTKKTRAEVPQGVQSSKWVPYYLNNRYFKTPANITIRTFPNQSWDSRVVQGMYPYLSSKSEISGTVSLDDVDIHYWVMQLDPTDATKLARSNACIETFHIASIYQNEIYGLKTGQAARSVINQFGIVHALKRMVIYAEPKHPLVLPEISRANLKIEGCDLPWAEWAQKFREAMPIELLNFEEQEASSKTVLSDIDDIKRILTAMIDYFKLTTYKPLKKGNTKAANTNPEELDSGEGGSGDEIGGTRGGGGGNGGGNGGGYGNGSGGSGKRPKKKHPYLPDKDGESATRTSGSIENMLPIVRWTDKPDQDVIGFAARYYPEKNELICNKDFIGFRNLHERLVEECSLVGADIMECWNLIEKHYALVLLEAIIGIKYAKDRLVWTSDNEQVALSPEALTAICMQRQAQVTSIKRELASKRF